MSWLNSGICSQKYICLHSNIHKYTWTPDAKTHSQIDLILTDITDVWSFTGAVVLTIIWWLQKLGTVRDTLPVSKWAAQKSDTKKFNIKKLNVVEVEEQYQNKISNRSATLENLHENVDITKAWESITENTRTSATDSVGYELKQHQPWFDGVLWITLSKEVG